MILAIDKHGDLSVFESATEAEIAIEAIDVQQEGFEFCDEHGRRLIPDYTIPPKVSKWWIFGVVEIGAFKLNSCLGDEGNLVPVFLSRAADHSEEIWRSSFSEIRTVSDLRKALATK